MKVTCRKAFPTKMRRRSKESMGWHLRACGQYVGLGGALTVEDLRCPEVYPVGQGLADFFKSQK